MSEQTAELSWIAQVLRRHLQETGRSAVDVTVQTFRATAGSGFASCLYEASASGEPLVVKLLPKTPRGTYRNLDQQYLNERHFYEEVFPFLASTDEARAVAGELFPRFFCAHKDDFQALISVEDLRPRGLAHAIGTLDVAHVKVALRELGRFHALSYVAKKNDNTSFLKIVNGVQQPRTKQICREISPMIKDFLKFAVESFRDFYPGDLQRFSGKLERVADLADVLWQLTEPEEPLAVCCHGDFHRDNVLFEYDVDGEPKSARFIDLQLKSYSSPAIDISLLLFMSSSPEVWQLPWDELVGVYHSSVLDTMAGVLRCPREELEVEYPTERFLEDFRRYSMHGFIVAMFFLPVAMLDSRTYSLIVRQVPGDVTTPDNSFKFSSLVRRYCSEDVRRCLATLLRLMMERYFI